MENLKKANELLEDEMHLLRKRINKLKSTETLQKKKNKRLVQKVRYYRSLLNCVHDDIMVIDRDYKITDVNKAFLVTCGHKREEVIGRFCYKISHGLDKPCNQHGEDCPLVKVFKTGRVHSAWHQHFHSGGWKTWVDIRLSPIVDEKGDTTLVIKSIRDVTELVKAGKSLEESEEKYRRIVAATTY
ncbi:MAG: PAS domain S-box protein [Deltaproteobacteria bacterium]|nr:PAS domain S-box protein [Deltaproteobacteria bacterium]